MAFPIAAAILKIEKVNLPIYLFTKWRLSPQCCASYIFGHILNNRISTNIPIKSEYVDRFIHNRFCGLFKIFNTHWKISNSNHHMYIETYGGIRYSYNFGIKNQLGFKYDFRKIGIWFGFDCMFVVCQSLFDSLAIKTWLWHHVVSCFSLLFRFHACIWFKYIWQMSTNYDVFVC